MTRAGYAGALLAGGLVALAGVAGSGRHRTTPLAIRASTRAGTAESGQRVAWAGLNAEDTEGHPTRLDFLRGRRVLLFFSCGCGQCRSVGRFLAGPGRALFADARVVTVATAPAQSARRLQVAGVLPGEAFADPDHTLANRFGVEACPTALAINPAGRLLDTATFRSGLDREAWRLAARLNPVPRNRPASATGGSAHAGNSQPALREGALSEE